MEVFHENLPRKMNPDKPVDVASLRKPYILPVITITTFAGTSLWFAGNAVVRDLQKAWVLGDSIVAYITSSVQVGFIVGTAIFAVTGIADQYPPGRVFCICCLIGAFFNASIYLFAFGLSQLLFLRFLIGFCLAGIYPLSLKIARGWYDAGLGFAMGCVVCALALGTAFPHLIKGAGGSLPWGATLMAVSVIAALGGIGMWWFIPDGPLLKKGVKFNPQMIVEIYRDCYYTQASLGYFGHMWEQYSFWGFLPTMIDNFADVHNIGNVNISIATFFIITAGALGSLVTGWGTKYMTNSFAAIANIGISGFCGIVHPIFYGYNSFFLYICLLLLWGWTVSADSPQFSALASRACKQELLGTALTVYNCIGYFMTVVSIQLCQTFARYLSMQYVSWIIALGPIVGTFTIASRVAREGMWIIPDICPRRSSSIVNASADVSMIREELPPKDDEIELKPMMTDIHESHPDKKFSGVNQSQEVVFDIGEVAVEPPVAAVRTPPQETASVHQESIPPSRTIGHPLLEDDFN